MVRVATIIAFVAALSASASAADFDPRRGNVSPAPVPEHQRSHPFSGSGTPFPDETMTCYRSAERLSPQEVIAMVESVVVRLRKARKRASPEQLARADQMIGQMEDVLQRLTGALREASGHGR